ncbi:MAG: cytochrome c biogenesis protein CcsA [Bacteroidota bacterium]
MHYFIGNLGHLFVITSFVTAILATYAFFQNSRQEEAWTKFSIALFYIHALTVIGICVTLFLIINNHYFEYHYAYNYTSLLLPYYYQISSFWNGQEGSFLLWMFWNAVLGLIIINTNKKWRAPVMTVFAFTQIFLTSMIMGVVVFDVKIGSSPFILLREAIQDPIFNMNPDFVPQDGKGLNPLLQNYWMVIHPPTLFLGFASTVVPFAYCMGGIMNKKYKEWIRPALPWAQFSAAILGIGILMGAYWAYETLNFGGYWNWDPVENAIYVPWLTLVASIHTMIAFRKSPAALKSSIILVSATYILIIYSTFLTRSGILGNTSVHSFTDLGLSGQLLIYLLVFIGITTFYIVKSWNKLPIQESEVSAYSREFWIFMGAITLSLMAFQVILPTSIPVYNSFMGLFGVDSNVAPPVDQVSFYTDFQLYFAVILAILSGTGQLFWWNKMDKAKLKEALTIPIIGSLLISGLIIVIAKIHNPGYLALLTASIYSVVANGKILLQFSKSNIKLSGGAIAHIGVALMLIGILFSSGYSKILSKNNTGLLWNKEFPDEVNQNNLLLFLNEPRQMGEYSLLYKGIRKKTSDDGFIDINSVSTTTNPLKLVVTSNEVTSTGKALNPGDTIDIINADNSYFEVLYQQESGKEFTLYPRLQMNETMGMTVFSPDINRTLTADLYSHVRTFPDPEQEIEWSEEESVKVVPGNQFFINDYVAVLKDIQGVNDIEGVTLGAGDIAVKAIIEIQGETKTYTAEPYYIIKDRMAGKIPATVYDLASRITIQEIIPAENSFVLGVSRTQKDWIILEAVEKPFINILWLGTLIFTIGFGIAIYRRYTEFIQMRNKGME